MAGNELEDETDELEDEEVVSEEDELEDDEEATVCCSTKH